MLHEIIKWSIFFDLITLKLENVVNTHKFFFFCLVEKDLVRLY